MTIPLLPQKVNNNTMIGFLAPQQPQKKSLCHKIDTLLGTHRADTDRRPKPMPANAHQTA